MGNPIEGLGTGLRYGWSVAERTVGIDGFRWGLREGELQGNKRILYVANSLLQIGFPGAMSVALHNDPRATSTIEKGALWLVADVCTNLTAIGVTVAFGEGIDYIRNKAIANAITHFAMDLFDRPLTTHLINSRIQAMRTRRYRH